MSLFDLKRGLLRSYQAKVSYPVLGSSQVPITGVLWEEPQGPRGSHGKTEAEWLSSHKPRNAKDASQTLPMLEFFLGLPSKRGLADTLFQLVASKTVRIVSVILGVQFVVNFCGCSRKLLHSKILQVKTTADFVFPVPAVWLFGSGQLHGLL